MKTTDRVRSVTERRNIPSRALLRGTGTVLFAAGLLLAPPRPAAAQDLDWLEDLAEQIGEEVERQAETIARAVEAHAEALERELERRFDDQQTDRDRERERQREQAERQREQRREALERQREQAEQQREQRREALERQREQREERRGPEVTEAFSRTVRLGRNGSFELHNMAGNVTVTGAGGDDVRIDATKRVRQRNDGDAKAMLRDIDIQVTERAGSVEVRTEYPRWRGGRGNWWGDRGWSGSVDYTVSVPRGANVTLRTVSGDLRVTNVDGALNAESVSGNVMAGNLRMVRNVKTVSGNLELTDSESDEVNGGTVSGNIVLRNVKARAIDVQSVSGDLHFEGVQATRANARSFSGDVDFRGPLARSGRYELQSHSGAVRVAPGGDGFSLDATTFSGDVRSDYALKLQPGSNSLGPGRRNNAIRASFGNAGATLSLQTFSGDIVLTQK